MKFGTKLLAPIALSLLMAPGTAPAFTIIDDFETGPVSLGITGDTVDVIVPVGPAGGGHVVTPDRHFTLSPHGTFGGTLVVFTSGSNPYDDYLFARSSNGYGNIRLEWDWAGTKDITEGGSADTLALTFGDVPASGGQLLLSIADGVSAVGATPLIPSAGTYKFPLSFWGNTIDLTQATSLSIEFVYNGLGDDALYTLSDIRTIGTGYITPNFLGEWTLVETNPLPSAPCVFATLDAIGNPVYKTEIGWQDIQVNGTLPALHGVWSTTPLGEGESCAITMTTDFDGGYIYEWFGYYEMFVDITSAGSMNAEIVFPPDPVDPGENSRTIGLPVHVMTYDGMGTPTGDSHILMTIDLMDGQPAELANPNVIPVYSKNQQTLTGFRVGFEMYTQDIILDSIPVIQVLWQSDWKEIAVSTSVAEGDAAVMPLFAGLVAAPSITRGATELRAARAFSPGDVIRVFDIRGRLVRELNAAAGMTTVVWDGRRSSGANAAPGVYFAHQTFPGEARPPGAARIVKVR